MGLKAIRRVAGKQGGKGFQESARQQWHALYLLKIQLEGRDVRRGAPDSFQRLLHDRLLQPQSDRM
jgi:hypothetical protein